MSDRDIRNTLIIADLFNGLNNDTVAMKYNVSTRLVRQILFNWRNHNIISSSYHYPHPNHVPNRCLLDSHTAHNLIASVMRCRSHTTLREYQIILSRMLNITVSTSTLWRFFKARRISYKRVSRLAYEAKSLQIARFFTIVHSIIQNANQMIFIDECGINAKSYNRRGGRAELGQRALSVGYFQRGIKMSLVLAVNFEATVDYSAIFGSFNTRKFWQFMFRDILPIVNRFPGPNSVIVMDNAAIHKNREYVRIFENVTGCIILWLPAYSPWLNLTEYYFNAIRMKMKRHPQRGTMQILTHTCWCCEWLRDTSAINTLRNIGYIWYLCQDSGNCVNRENWEFVWVNAKNCIFVWELCWICNLVFVFFRFLPICKVFFLYFSNLICFFLHNTMSHSQKKKR